MSLPPPVPPPSSSDRPVVRTRDINGRLIAFGVVAVLAIVFILQNRARVYTHFLFLSFHTRVWVAMALSMVAGVVADRLFAAWWRRRSHRESKS